MRNGTIPLMMSIAVGLMLCLVASQTRTNADEAAASKFNVLLIVSEDNSPDLSIFMMILVSIHKGRVSHEQNPTPSPQRHVLAT